MNVAFHYVSLGDGLAEHTAQLMMVSARRAIPGCTIWHLTDSETKGLGDYSLRSPEKCDPDHIMVHRMLLMWQFVKQVREAVIFVDPDVIFNRDPGFSDCDVALTWRDPVPGKVYGSMPFNTGVMYATPKSLPFWDAATDIAEALPRALRRWYGDQMTLSALIGLDAFKRRRSGRMKIAGTTVRLYPCEAHNFTPEEEPTAPLPASIVHFKGDRKRWMPGYLRIIAPDAFSSDGTTDSPSPTTCSSTRSSGEPEPPSALPRLS